MTLWDSFGYLKAVFVLNVLVTSTMTSGQEVSQKVMYVTGCLGSNSVMLHQMTSSEADDVRAVFVYKGGEILGSDIIPAQGDYKGRLQISRQGDVTLSDLRLWDSGVFRIEMTMRDSKTSTYVVLVVPEAPVVAEGRLVMYRAVSSSHRDHVRLACGTFSALGYPAASVLWLDPEGRLLSSTGYTEGQFLLDLPPSSPPGNYSCLLHCAHPHPCCLPSGSPLSQHATVHIHTSPTPSVTSQPTAELTSALEQAGENMAAGMAALVNEQMQASLDTSSEKFQMWKDELEQKMENRFREMNIRLEKVLEDRFEEMAGNLNSDGGRGVEDGAKISLLDTQKIFERDVYSKMKNSIQILYRQMDEGRKNMSDFQKKINNKINSFQRKLKGLRLTMKRHGVYKHDRTIKNLIDSTDTQFKEITHKLRDLETNSQPSDQLLQNFQTRLNDMGNKLNQGEVSLGSFQRSITRKMEDLRDQVAGLDSQVRRHESSRHSAADRKQGHSQAEDSSNDTKAVLGRPSRPEVSQREHPHRERQPYGRGYGQETGDSASVNYDNAPVSETCVAAQRKGGTGSGVYTLRPDVRLDPQPFWCDMDTDGGGWIVVQRRQDGSEDFFRPWDDYVQGFGDPHGEFWLGLDRLHYITTGTRHSLRVELRTYSQVQAFALYLHFRVLGPHHNYLMSVSGYSGTAGDGLFVHDGKPFSTWNKDHDDWLDGHCAANYRSAWWYAKCRVCDLNAPHTNQSHGIMWLYGDDLWGAGKVAFVEMKIRPEQ